MNRPDWRIALQADHILRLEGQINQLNADKHELLNKILELVRVGSKYKKALKEIITFFAEDKKFVRYDGNPIIFCDLALQEIKKMLKENDIEISEEQNDVE